MIYGLVLVGSVCYLANIVESASKTKWETVYMITDVSKCSDLPNLPTNYNTVELANLGKGKVLFSSDIYANEGAQSVSCMFTASKCSTAEITSCEHFLRVAIPNLCPKFVEKGQFYTPMFETIHPPLRCPIKKGYYKQINGSFDSTELVKMGKNIPYTENYFWKFRMLWTAQPSKKDFFCNIITIKANRVKVKKSN